MSELDNLRPEVRSALGAIVRADVCRDPVPTDAFDTIRAELLRLAGENMRLSGRLCLVCGLHNDSQCPQRNDEMSPCTFDPSPVEAAKAFFARATKAEAELAALKARIRGACLVPLTAVMLRDGYSLTVSGPMSVNDVDELAGKRVRLVVEE